MYTKVGLQWDIKLGVERWKAGSMADFFSVFTKSEKAETELINKLWTTKTPLKIANGPFNRAQRDTFAPS